MKGPRIKKWWLIRLAMSIVGKKGLRELIKAPKNGEGVTLSFGMSRTCTTTSGTTQKFYINLFMQDQSVICRLRSW